MAGFYSDNDELQKYLKKLEVDQTNRQTQGMDAAAANPAANPYQDSPKSGGGWTDIVGPLMKTGGMVANLLGQPEIGIPLSIAGGAVGGGGHGGGFTGALTGGVKSGIGQGISAGMGAGLDFLTGAESAAPEAIMTGSKLSAPLSAAMKDPGMMSSLGDNLAVSDPLRKLTSPYASMSGMDVMNAQGKNSGLFGGS